MVTHTRNEGSGVPDAEILRCAQDDSQALRMTARTPLKYCHPEPIRCAQGKLRAGPLTGSLLSKRLGPLGEDCQNKQRVAPGINMSYNAYSEMKEWNTNRLKRAHWRNDVRYYKSADGI